ncbi:alpha/beta hydrolase [Streptococcus moroccensis]|uniref:Acetyl esterase/lipase n=1 Tax=Streptococcus moroccensis TaxID=1451356 RepID=A0ABT9YT92_9STRE|nr:alpha/beta hydrolase [Streptococcus moroccensis]MDQ0223195.1 acetyl esterase/lipase [Streptococcus moroccensis]
MIIKTFNLDENRTNVDLTTYIISDSPELLDGKKRPAILICPGGAYLNCSDREGEAIALRFASMGYHAFVLRYHVLLEADDAFEQLFSRQVKGRADTVFPAAIHDIAQALTLIHDHAGEWLVDTDKIALCGFSAGGNNVTNYSVHWNKPIVTDVFDVTKIKPAAIIAGYPITDYFVHEAHVKTQDKMAQGLFRVANISLFGTESPSEEQLLQASAARLVDDTTPPTFIWATAGDMLVPVSQSTRLGTALAEAGIPFELHIFEEGQHGLALATQATAAALTEVNADARQWVDLAEAWLQKRFALPLKEKSRWI